MDSRYRSDSRALLSHQQDWRVVVMEVSYAPSGGVRPILFALGCGHRSREIRIVNLRTAYAEKASLNAQDLPSRSRPRRKSLLFPNETPVYVICNESCSS